MKKLLTCLAASLILVSSAFAQRGLNSFPVFKGKVVPNEKMVITEARGGSMATYKLDYYRSVSFLADAALAAKVSAMVEADADASKSVETEKEGPFLTYALVQPKPAGKRNRYLCYQARPVAEGLWKITLLYLEGSATVGDLKSMFEKQ